MKTRLIYAIVAAAVIAASAPLSAQQLPMFYEQGGRQAGRQVQPPQGPPQNPDPMNPQNGPKNPKPNDQMSPVYIQQMFDTMAIMEAERFLPLNNEQYPVFVQRLRRLQETRMQSNRRRTKALNELRALVGPQAQPDVADSLIDAKLKELAAAEVEGAAAVRKALDDLEAGLTTRQRARYRLLEENVERRKIDFLTKVRGGGPGPGLD
jgi:hypothetical protein